jgi:hypothetical protein
MNDSFTFANRLQQYRACKAFEVTFINNWSFPVFKQSQSRCLCGIEI